MKFAQIQPGDRFGRWLVVGKSTSRKYYVSVLCECGEQREVYAAQLLAGNSKSCGCFRSDETSRRMTGQKWRLGATWNEEQRRTIGAQSRERWASGAFETPAVRAQREALAASHAGVPESGANAKGPDHHLARDWRIKSPCGVVIEGKNLRHLVQEHAHLFDPEDVKPTIGKTGLERTCRAALGLIRLFSHGENKRNSWKGWTAPPQS